MLSIPRRCESGISFLAQFAVMAESFNSTVYIGNLDDRVTDRVLYDILIQAGRVVDLHIPRDRETNKSKGYAFAEYESEEVAEYAVKLFTGLVTLYKRTLRFSISGQDKPSTTSLVGTQTTVNSSTIPRPRRVFNSTQSSVHTPRLSTSYQIPEKEVVQPQVPSDIYMLQLQHDGYRLYGDNTSYHYNQRLYEPTLDSVIPFRSRFYEMPDWRNENPYH